MQVLRAVFVCLLMAIAACGPDPAVVKAESVRDGDRLVKEQKYADAIAAYRRGIAADPRDGLLRLKLADAYSRAGRGPQASTEAARAIDLLPNHVDAKLQAAALMLPQGRFADVAGFMSVVLRDQPQNARALVLWGNATAKLLNSTWALYKLTDGVDTLDKFERTRRELRPAVPEDEDRAAHAAFRKALDLAPEMMDAQLALVNFLWATGRADAGEVLLKRVADQAPQHAFVNHVLGSFYLLRDRSAEGEPYLKKAARYTAGSRFALADLYVKDGRDVDALAMLSAMTTEDDGSGAVTLRAVAIEQRQGKHEPALRRLEALLARQPAHGRALVLKAQILLATGRADQALKTARSAVTATPTSGDARFALGQALSATNDLEAAFNEFVEAARLSPGSGQIPAAMARLALATGRDKVALAYAREAVRKQPDDQEATVAVVKALVRLKDYSAADQELKPLLTRYPASADLFVQLGLIRAARGDAGAREPFQRALKLSPDSFDALSGLVLLDLDQRQIAAARQRVDQALAQHPAHPGYLELASRVFAAAGDPSRAESTLRRVLDLDRGNVTASLLLADGLNAQNRRDEARRVLEQVLERMPSSIAAQTSLAMTLEQMGRSDEARARYEKIVEQNPGAAVAASRLAHLYMSRGESLDLALQLVRTAKQQSPNDPIVNDALGWVYVQKGHLTLAVPYLEEAVQAEPRSPAYRYHLGTAYLRARQFDKARDELTRALQLDGQFADRAKAQAALDLLKK